MHIVISPIVQLRKLKHWSVRHPSAHSLRASKWRGHIVTQPPRALLPHTAPFPIVSHYREHPGGRGDSIQ